MMRSLITIYFIVIVLFGCLSVSHAQMTDTERSNWLLGVIFKLENMRDKAIADIKKYEGDIQKCDGIISKSENIVKLAQQKGNVQAEIIARDASIKAQEARIINRKNKNSAEFNKKRAENALAYVKTGGKNPESTLEQVEFENMNADWMKKQNQLIEQRLAEPNKYAGAIYNSLKTNAPPLPWKTFNELQPGDVLLIEGKGIAAVDNKFSSGDNASKASHTVIYLKEVNGKKLFLDNQPFEGPRIISEDEFLKRYSPRGAEVAKLAQPLNEKEGKQLFSAAVELAQKNNKKLVNEDTWFGKYLSTDTNYGAWGKENVVCSESDWALINNAGRNIPKSGDRLKVKLGVDFSPADYKNSPYFLVTPFW